MQIADSLLAFLEETFPMDQQGEGIHRGSGAPGYDFTEDMLKVLSEHRVEPHLHQSANDERRRHLT
jgi:hypothetical protein